ncbi:MAG: DUF3798 domain-containing protein [Candidatus Wallbacteria bacterium]|nr:DUF3798 domain-containing protein [Candidatus Wallbacteria bacterium]MBI4867267.1 DUF3798 domain-containing protein [Candidatus Wallbacteria bacterium]
MTPSRVATRVLGACAALFLATSIARAADPAPAAATPTAAAPAAAAPKPAAGPFKIGIVTGTVSQGEDEFRAAATMAEKYPAIVKHVTYPDNFMQEQETTISQVAGLAADPEVKAIVIAQAIPGTMAAIQKVKANRPDMKFLLVEPHEDVDQINKAADVVFNTDNLARGVNMINLAKKMGAKKFLHYSFPRHMSMQLLAQRRQKMEEEAKKIGIEFLNVSAPDPMGEGGLPATQQFVLEDVPRKIAEHGADIAFFSTNCGMQEPLIRAVLDGGALYPEQCCPSPTHGYPGALGIEIPKEKSGDMKFLADQIREKVKEAGRSGRFATWYAPFNIMAIQAAIELAKAFLEGKADLQSPSDAKKFLQDQAPGQAFEVNRWNESVGHFYNVVCESQIF